MKKALTLFLILYFSITCYLIEYKINDIQYRLFYDTETDIVEMWNPYESEIFVSIEMKKHWIDNYNNHYNFNYINKNYDYNKYGFVEGFGR